MKEGRDFKLAVITDCSLKITHFSYVDIINEDPRG